jgi:hypothetical protein
MGFEPTAKKEKLFEVNNLNHSSMEANVKLSVA